jgi:hypothetical protein
VLDKSSARGAIEDPRILRLMTVPGTSITATTFVAVIGDIRKFNTARQLVGYLGSRVRQSGPGPHTHKPSVCASLRSTARARHGVPHQPLTYIRHPAPTMRLSRG